MYPFFKNMLANLHTIILVWLVVTIILAFIQIKILKKDTGMAVVHSALIASLVTF